MDLVFTLVCNGELSLARVLRKNILDKVEQKKLLRYTNSLKPLAARGVSARYFTSNVTFELLARSTKFSMESNGEKCLLLFPETCLAAFPSSG